jgi:hypothetical protein
MGVGGWTCCLFLFMFTYSMLQKGPRDESDGIWIGMDGAILLI